jgi:hypothetical protein
MFKSDQSIERFVDLPETMGSQDLVMMMMRKDVTSMEIDKCSKDDLVAMGIHTTGKVGLD